MYNGLAEVFTPLEAVFKNGEFDEEQEWRAILPKYRAEARHFQVGRDDIVPFILIPITGNIKAVCIGPRSRVSESDLSTYLKHHLDAEVTVSRSRATLQ